MEREKMVYEKWPLDKSGCIQDEEQLLEELGLMPFTQIETIESDLATHAQFDDELFLQVETLMNSLSERVTALGSLLYDLDPKCEDMNGKESDPFLGSDNSDSSSESSEEEEEKMFSKAKGNKQRLRGKATKKLRQARTRGMRGGEKKSDKRVEDAIFLGFDNDELTPLPGKIDPLKVLDFVSRNQEFSPVYMGCWRKMFYSEVSSAILQDLFWLLWLDRFNVEADIEADTQASFLIRLSVSYVKLFQLVPVKFRDLFFLKYSDCLAQSLYVAFWALFPGSRLHFGAEFRRFISTLVHKTVIGLQPHPLSWNEWKIDPSKFSQCVLPSRDSQSSIHKLAPLLKTPSPDRGREEERHLSPDLSPQELPDHPFGLSPIFHNVKFNILGRSPLLACYMHSIGITRNPGSVYINRTEILAIPSASYTYKQMMEQIKKDTEVRDEELRSVFKRLDSDVSKNWKACRKEMNQYRAAATSVKPYRRFLKRIPD